MKRKTRHEKLLQYEEKYGSIPDDHQDRLQYIADELGINSKQQAEIMEAYHNAIDDIRGSNHDEHSCGVLLLPNNQYGQERAHEAE